MNGTIPAPSRDELENAIWKAREAREQGENGWQADWIKALDLLSKYIDPWESEQVRSTDGLSQAALFLSLTIDMLRDERIGARAYFWQPASNRPPKAREIWTIERAIVVLVAACRERERRTESGRDAYQVAQTELRKRGHDTSLKRLRSIVSNSGRMPESERGAAAFAIEALGVKTFDPGILIAFCADFLGRQKGPL